MFKLVSNLSKDDVISIIYAATQSVIAVVIVFGGGLFIATQPAASPAVITAIGTLIGSVLTFYFTTTTTQRANDNALKTQAQTSDEGLKK